MGYERIKAEHVGAKNRGGAWTTRFEAKQAAKRKRRQADKRIAAELSPAFEMSRAGASMPQISEATVEQ
jgi:hypothetical protein